MILFANLNTWYFEKHFDERQITILKKSNVIPKPCVAVRAMRAHCKLKCSYSN